MNPKIVMRSLIIIKLVIICGISKASNIDTLSAKFKYNKVISITSLVPTSNYSINQAKIIKEYKRSALIRQINISYQNDKQTIDILSPYGINYRRFLGTFSLIKQFGLKNNHLNLGIGQTVTHESVIDKNESVDKYFDGYTFAVIGYSHWNPMKRFYLNISIFSTYGNPRNPNFTITRDFSIIPGITIGYCYDKGPAIPFLKKYHDSDPITSKLSVGYENSFGYSKSSFSPFGNSEGFAMSNYIVLQYYPSRLYFKALIGNSKYFYQTYITKSESADPHTYSTNLFDSKQLFWNYGAGIGYHLANICKWQIMGEALIGTFFQKALIINPKIEISGIKLNENIDNSLRLPIEMKWFTSLGLTGKRKLSEKFDISVGFVYKSSQLRPRLSYYRMKVNDYLLSLNLSYKIK